MRWRTRIFELAAERGWSDTRLAHELGVNQSTVWHQRHGKRTPSPKLLWAAARVFHRDPSELWWQEQAPDPEAREVVPA